MTNIVMLVRDRLKLTEQAIESLYDHTPQKDFTLTIVDDESDFLTRRYLAGIDRENMTMLRVENSGHRLGQLKNLGVCWTQMRFPHEKDADAWLYLSDNDVWFSPEWMGKLVSAAQVSERYRFRLWGGQIHPFHHRTECIFPFLDSHEVIDGPSWLMRWETWNTYGPLDSQTAPGVCQSEEYPFCQRLRGDGLRLGVIRPHVVVHTGLTNSDGVPAPGAEERRKMIPEGVYAE